MMKEMKNKKEKGKERNFNSIFLGLFTLPVFISTENTKFRDVNGPKMSIARYI